uniref:Asp-tRNA(Asn)/Glu-tRNA(Gln) amidotransferase subunit GatC n=1 Tax=Bacillus paramobilis TaxID=2817477 RepID=UPI001C817E92
TAASEVDKREVLRLKNIMREDVPEKGLPVDEVLKNSADQKGNQIRVPAVFE